MKHFRRKLKMISKVSKLSRFKFVPMGYLQRSRYRMDPKIVETALRDLENGDYVLKTSDSINFKHPRTGTRNNFMYNGSFHEAIAPVLVMAQCFCVMPVRGVKSKSASGLSFTWFGFRTLYSVTYVMGTIVDSILTIGTLWHSELDFRDIEPVVFHISIFISAVCFLRLAMNWPVLMRSWEKVEQELPPHRNQKDRDQLGTRIKMITFVAMMMSLMEHLLSTISAIHFANFCPVRPDPIESYFVTVVPQMFLFSNYSHILAWLGKIENVLLTFGWSYMDIFLMIIGVGLSAMLQQVQRKMVEVKGKEMPSEFWAECRIQYRSICNLIDEVDEAVSAIIMLSFANNLYFVCIQLLKSINKLPSVAHIVYFYFSLSYLLGRTLAVSLYLAEVNDRSKEPLDVLQYIPPNSWCPEVERFADEVSKDTIALTGMKFFNITRKLVLTIAGTIVTYELVLIQFHEDKRPYNCGE